MRSTISSRLLLSWLGPSWAAAMVTMRAMSFLLYWFPNILPGHAELGDLFADQPLDLPLESHELRARALARMREGHVHDLLDGAGLCGHDHDAVGEEDGLRDAVGDEDHGLLVLLPDPQELLLHDLARLRVQRPEGLVHQEHRGVVGQRPRDGHPLLHAAGKLARVLALVLGEADEREVRARGGAALGARHALDHGAELHVLDGRAPGEERVLLEDHPAIGARVGDLAAVHEDIARGGLDEARDHVEQRGLPAARWTEEAGEAVLRQLEADLVEGERALRVALGHPLDLDGLHDLPRDSARQRRRRPSSLRKSRLAVTPMIPITAAPRSMLETRKKVRASLMR